MPGKGCLVKQRIALVLLAFGLLLGTAWAQKESVVYIFCQQSNCADGLHPTRIAIGATGILFGTTSQGGDKDQGTVFGITPEGREIVNDRFCATNCINGSDPNSLILYDGNLYGTTPTGGTGPYGQVDGTVFKLTPGGGETILYNFCSLPDCADGSLPNSLTIDKEGNLYGTTGASGSLSANDNNGGTVFKITPEGQMTTLYTFCKPSCARGLNPTEVVLDQEGNLYGVAGGGIHNSTCDLFNLTGCGVIFKLTPEGQETVLHTFCAQSGCPDGWLPVGLILRDGNLFGVTYSGGASANLNDSGTLFKITQAGQFTVLHNFGVESGDGGQPSGGLVFDQKGNLYGNTFAGGANCPEGGCGTVFRITPENQETVVYSFCAEGDCSGGEWPMGNLVLDHAGNLYGVTQAGGDQSGGAYGPGVVFRLVP